MWTNGKVIANFSFRDGRTVRQSGQNPSIKRAITPSNVTLTLRIWHHLERVVISNIIWKFDEEMWTNGKVIANFSFRDGRTVRQSGQIPSIKRAITPLNVTLTLRIRHHLERVVISNIIWKFDEEMWTNGKVIANFSFRDGRTVRQSGPYESPFLRKGDTKIVNILSKCMLSW
jgi:hypothetical protein